MHYEMGQRIAKQDEDANKFYLIIQGSILASYKLAEKDKAAVFLGKKDVHEDGLIKSLQALSHFKT